MSDDELFVGTGRGLRVKTLVYGRKREGIGDVTRDGQSVVFTAPGMTIWMTPPKLHMHLHV